MADPIMDLFDDPNLFGLDSLTGDSFGRDGPDTIDDALGLANVLGPLEPITTDRIGLPGADAGINGNKHHIASQVLPDNTALVSTTEIMQPCQTSTNQETLNQGNPFMGASNAGTGAPKIMILKAPAGMTVGACPVTQIQTLTPHQTANGGKVTFAKVLTGTPLRPGVSIVSGNTVLAKMPSTGVAGQVGAVRPVRQLVLQPMRASTAPGSSDNLGIKPAVTLTSTPQQGDPKRITLVLQQPPQAGATAPLGQRHVVLGGLPGKIVLQGNQLAALTQAKTPQGQQAKIVTIQLQVQQQPGAAGQIPQKFQIVQQAQGGIAIAPSGQQTHVLNQQGVQRFSVPLKVILQPQAGCSQGTTQGLSVVKVLNANEVANLTASQTVVKAASAGGGESRRQDSQKKQEKANRIVAEAIARARARGEQNIPRVLNEDELPSVNPEDDDGSRRKRKKKKGETSDRSKDEKPKKVKGSGSSKSKSKGKPSTITPIVGKKRKRNPSSDNSDAEMIASQASPGEDEDSVQKRRSNRQVKRKKYTEDLDIKITDDEDDEEVDVTGPVKTEHVLLPEPMLIPDNETAPSMQFFVENPSEEDAAIVDKILSMRFAKKELPTGEYFEIEEYFVKYKNYSYLHCEWATIEQLERDKRIHQKLKRFKTKITQMQHFLQEDEESFNPDYVEVDRILDESHSTDKDNGEPVVYYLIKWCSLPYEDSTWELKEDVDDGKIEEFKQIEARQPNLKRVARPAATSWKKLELSREYLNGNQLREYQLEGVNWLLFNWYNRQNCILADEMGLGKTIQSITFLQELYNVGIRGPFLVIAPLSTITNWEREFASWTQMNTIVYHGSLASRQMIQQYEMYCKDSKGHLIPGAYKFDALITTFEMVLSDCPELREIEWRCVIIDEAHRLKNRNCKLLDSLKHMDLEHKVLLTGTPLQNTVEELFSLLHFLEPTQFSSEAEFLKDFGDLKTEEQVQKLQAILKPMMLRRLKEDVEKNLAPKQETIIEVELTNIQKKYYRAILEKNFSFLTKGASQSNTPNLLNTMMELRKCCNHPYLITGAEEKIMSDFREATPVVPLDFHLQAMVRSSGKLVLIDKLLPKLRAGGHKVLIFSQMVRCLDILEDYLIQRRYLYERIDGRVRGNMRQAAIDRFSRPDSDRFVFLLCTRAGGLGINLTAADTCIIFDSDWNPQNDLQAQARCHRIGQSKAVKIYRLITRNSYEREMFDKASLKLGLDKAVLQSMSGRDNHLSGPIQQFTKKEIEDLLRKGAYAAIMDEDDEGSKFCEEDIDQILLRRTTTITIESEGQGSTFAKASFVASENRTDISLDDPNFWQKWAKKADIDMNLLNSKNTLVIDTPRIRKQTRHFTNKDDDMVEFSDLESDDDDRPKARRQDRKHGYGRTDCFRVEKHLLVYGWGRWRDILMHGRFKRGMTERDVEKICRAILVYCLLHYRGDENIKSFIWDLITPAENGKTKQLQNHSGLSIPVPRGRKGKKVKSQSSFDIHKAEWIHKYNPDTLFQDEGYKKHLKHQCNKVLLRVRMLYFLRQEVIGNQAMKVLSGVDARHIDTWFPQVDQVEVPSRWWDREADKSLLIGVFKHGYEKYNTMRADPALCFLEKVGGPDEQAIAAEHHAQDFSEMPDGGDFDRDIEDPEYKPLHAHKEPEDEIDSLMMDEEISVVDGEEATSMPSGMLWPPGSALTARLRRLITAFQRSYKREQLKLEAEERGDKRRKRCEAAFKLKEIARREKQQRWTRREACDFFRVLSSFGVEYDPDTQLYDWQRFRGLARLDKKTDESLLKYFHGFVAMCRQVCRLPPAAGDEPPDPSLFIEPISEERASRALFRLDLLRRVREQVLCHPLLIPRLSLCRPDTELPEWWESGRHDHELLQGAARYGLSRTDLTILQDHTFSFLRCQISYFQSRGISGHSRPSTPTTAPPVPTERQPSHLASLSSSVSCSPAPRRSSSCSSSSSSSNSEDSSDESNGVKVKPNAGLPHARLYDEESRLSLAASPADLATEDSTQTALETPSSADWPKDRVLLCRIEQVCSAVLTGKWSSPRRLSDPLSDSPDSLSPTPEQQSPVHFTQIRSAPDPKEFTIQIKSEEGLKIKFQKHKFTSNGALDSAPHTQKKKSKKKMDLDMDMRIPVVNQKDGTLLLGEEAPLRCQLPEWLHRNPDFMVDPRFIAFMEDRRKRKKHRSKKSKSSSQIGNVQNPHPHNGKKSSHTENSFETQHLPTAAKKRKKRPPSKIVMPSALHGAGDVTHSFSDLQPDHSGHSMRSVYGPSDGGLSHQAGLSGLGFTRFHSSQTSLVGRIHGTTFDELQSFEPPQRHFSLLDDPMMPANSSSSGDELDRP
ncbi:chromodomain-helicase-DNA-binding protein 8 isoform X1 [Xenopus laevis]|uniref:Chromodomain-helicase-DNA-binding protein 8 n=1 Tax=Xenopus laevis TaxID=8355 RepID=A0A8J0V5F4_XENLA|nr:chromodomain-helicase-DNA-binding protein 8 isoform X1 [Xenopus laevis]XP_018115302.1 chromodomain-helicase-DNA-binding protein 8 isoform X1 [Xenopus laevis]XP_018115308.1 chromodomain-helicase-DNA-binding protein 8 isoform X1 [Xenopus laevis]